MYPNCEYVCIVCLFSHFSSLNNMNLVRGLDKLARRVFAVFTPDMFFHLCTLIFSAYYQFKTNPV